MDLAVQKDKLIALQKEVEVRAERLDMHQRRGETEMEQDSSERAVQLENDEVIDRLDEMAHDTLEHIKVALDRIESGVYEICSVCEEPIGNARLSQIPYATHCVACEEELQST